MSFHVGQRDGCAQHPPTTNKKLPTGHAQCVTARYGERGQECVSRCTIAYGSDRQERERERETERVALARDASSHVPSLNAIAVASWTETPSTNNDTI